MFWVLAMFTSFSKVSGMLWENSDPWRDNPKSLSFLDSKLKILVCFVHWVKICAFIIPSFLSQAKTAKSIIFWIHEWNPLHLLINSDKIKYYLYGPYRLIRTSQTHASFCDCPSVLPVNLALGYLGCKFTCEMNQWLKKTIKHPLNLLMQFHYIKDQHNVKLVSEQFFIIMYHPVCRWPVTTHNDQ